MALKSALLNRAESKEVDEVIADLNRQLQDQNIDLVTFKHFNDGHYHWNGARSDKIQLFSVKNRNAIIYLEGGNEPLGGPICDRDIEKVIGRNAHFKEGYYDAKGMFSQIQIQDPSIVTYIEKGEFNGVDIVDLKIKGADQELRLSFDDSDNARKLMESMAGSLNMTGFTVEEDDDFRPKGIFLCKAAEYP